ncbi:chemotaxis protein CheR [Ectothiorhodospira haloalkaliphila]|uniref:Chemotaxis protein methyltransferase n=1 Tax=Ectothiorhodospira haloalkaliphila TaxID=421628 RepID=W8L4Z2_9GAMM|nr:MULTISPECIES: CheR family methyltransferase [Ectothiorhodospira]AHK78970.1 chemotaxis protein CheR [Ectothiorhodospira haloalkaliphila]MCG5493754.1 chemotaxis protein CheR [Ectothiorhodospira variabilis]MCG5497845.1 chemotaxis protein CheR [Ectothiorhodospira variabilis]MCG5503953.1 chemotaxis protein CheR [Ectothiorhodospira variabilis]MCG5507108.1 chemotaxis protein CheR [Ectothiorhodospira variabilis]
MRDREFDFRDADFERIRRMIYEYAGISLNPGKRDMVYSRVARRLRQAGLNSFEAYLDRLEVDAEEWQHFVNSLTTNLTSFFREAHHFPVLSEHATRMQGRLRRTLRIWSAGCSTGEEPFSIAMTLIDAFGSWTPPVKILATDLDTQVVRHAAEGIYPMERIDKMPQSDVKRFFLRGKGSREGMVRVRPQVRELITFESLNLLGPSWPLKEPFDAIFCRNVLIYFDKPTQYRLLSRFHPLLHPEGLLFVGHSESLAHASDLFRLQGKTVCVPVARGRP